MARPAEITEKAIIDAGLNIIKRGKQANPGSIRAELGYRGGLNRIKRVWVDYQESKTNEGHISFELDDLPLDVSELAEEAMLSQAKEFTQLVITIYQRCQSMFEKRLNKQVLELRGQISYYEQFEADLTHNLDEQTQYTEELEGELKELAQQNASLIIENAELRGRLSKVD